VASLTRQQRLHALGVALHRAAAVLGGAIQRSVALPFETRPVEMAKERRAVLRLDDVPTWTTMHLITLSFAMTYCVIDAWY